MQSPDWMLTTAVPQAGFGRRWRAQLAQIAVAAFEMLLGWQARAAERTRLASMDDRMLRDIGLSRADIARESAKPFWTP